MKRITLLFGLLLATQSWAQDCGALSFYTENFEGVTVPAIPTCATTSASGGSNNWVTANNPGNGFESNTLQFTGNASAANAWYFTKGIVMTAGTYYKISYRYGNNNAANTENLVVTLGTAGNTTDGQFVAHDVTGGAPVTNTIDFYPAQGTGTYYFGFHATSAAGLGNIYVDDIIIEPTTCNTPANVKVTNVLSTSATFTWDATADNNTDTFSVYHYGYMTTNTPPASPPDLKFSPTTSIGAADLLPSTTYYLFVRAQCGPVNGDWSEAIIFTTPACNAAALPYSQDFESATAPGFPSCTSVSPVEAGNQWVTVNNPGSSFTNNTLEYTDSSEPANAWFFTQGIAIPAGSYKISYKYGNDSATTTESLKVIMASSPNPASQLSVVGEQAAITGGTSATYANGNPITIGETGIYYFGFNANSAADQGSLYVDDILIETWTCSEPANITASNISTTGAIITWEAVGNPAVGYLYDYNTTNTTPTTEAFVSGVTKTLEDLEPGTTYYFFVKGVCGNVMGEWSESISFTTPACESTTVPYILDFESATVPAVPTCTIAHEAVSGNDWVTGTNPGSGFDSKALVYTGTNDAANSWFYTQGVQITAGTMYKISYKYGNNSATTTENLKVTINSNPNPNYQIGENFADHTGITGGVPATNAVEYFNLPTGVYYFGFNAHSDAGQGSIFVDDFKIEVIDCGEPVNGQATDITDASATITWEAATSGNATPSVYQFTYGTSDELPTEAGDATPSTTKALEGLTPDTQYYAFVRVQCGPTFSEWITIPFHTEVGAGLNDNTFTGLTAYPNPVKNVLNLDANSIIENVEVYSITGQLVLKQTVNSQNTTVNLQQLSAGVYLVNVSGEGASKRIKIIKE